MRAPIDKLEVLLDAAALAARVAGWMLDLANQQGGRFAVALSGGSTPKRLYQALAAAPTVGRMPWFKTHWFWGDERFVPRDSALSNYRMIEETLLSQAPIPTENIYGVPIDGMTPETAAAQYQDTLTGYYGAPRLDPDRPLFDLVLMGLGGDGHTASLFPGHPVLDERQKWVAAVEGAKEEPRITLTYPALDSCRHMAFLVEGEGKRAMLARLLAGDSELPAARVRPSGTCWIFADAAAAGGMSLPQ